MRSFVRTGLLLFFFFLASDIFPQCAMCKQAAASSMNNPNSLASGLNPGILYLMAVPYLALCFIFRKQIAALFRKVKGKFLQRAAG